jgi:protein PhnA
MRIANAQRLPAPSKIVAQFLSAARYACSVGDRLVSTGEMSVETKDCYGNTLSAGDSVMLIKDLKVKGTSVTLKQGTKIKNIRLTDSEEEIECNTDKVKGLVLRTEFLKKV